MSYDRTVTPTLSTLILPMWRPLTSLLSLNNCDIMFLSGHPQGIPPDSLETQMGDNGP